MDQKEGVEGFVGFIPTHAMQSGLLFGYVSMVEGMVVRFRKELGDDMKVIASWLTLDGLWIIWELNQT